ncbi:unnamed protein product [Thelazia callipaeda]|uniref:UPF0505 protein C16orf62 homolog n=1 Tax=Thelazia callipaeda TaxID=103827 RepID=A0A0N5CUG8_THECL|nr:unnamed protein product [Thelazia callipaeda]
MYGNVDVILSRSDIRMNGLFNDSLVTWKWKIQNRSWEKEAESWKCPGATVLIDPLSSPTSPVSSLEKQENQVHKREKPEFADPLGWLTLNVNIFLLFLCGAVVEKRSAFAITEDIPTITKQKVEPKLINTLVSSDDDLITLSEKELPGFVPWSVKKQDILKHFSNINDSKSSYLHCVPGLKKTDLPVTNRVAQRFEQLENIHDWKQITEHSNVQVLSKIKELQKNLELTWVKGKRITTINIAVEITRILSSVSTPEFYVRVFVYVTDILDRFGYLVYDRLYSKANQERLEAGLSQLCSNFEVNDIPKNTRDTAMNWFCKIGDIRELLPRFYVESALIGCIRFFDAESLKVNLMRLAKIPVLLPNLLVSSYARVYLCHVAMRLIPNDRAPHWKCLNDQINAVSFTVLPSLIPALEWIIQCVTYNGRKCELEKMLLNFSKDNEKRTIVLPLFLRALSSDYISKNVLDLMELLVSIVFSKNDNIVCFQIIANDDVRGPELCVFGEQLMENNMMNDVRQFIFKNCWQKTIKLLDIRDFIECSTVWIEFAARYFSLDEVSVVLEAIIKRVTANKVCQKILTLIRNIFAAVNNMTFIQQKYESFLNELLGIMEKITHWVDNIESLLILPSFQKFVDFFRTEQQRGNCAIMILLAFINSCELSSVSDLQLANQVLNICQLLHDSLNALSTEEEKHRSSYHIVRALNRFNLQSDPEQALDFYVDARAALSNLDNVIAYLVTEVCSLGLYVARQEQISQAGKIFIRACVAYAFITIASLSSVVIKIELYMQAGILSLVGSSLPQLDGILRSSIEELARAQNLSASCYRSLCCSFLAFLVLVPDSPNKNPLYMFNAFLNAIARYPWQNGAVEHGQLLLDCIWYLSTIIQPELPYHLMYGDIQSNDTLYGSSKIFTEAVEEKNEIVMGRLEDVYKQDKRKLSVLATEILEVILALGDVELLTSLILELYIDCIARPELKERRKFILKRIEYLADKKGELKTLYKQLCDLEYSCLKNR